MRSTTFTSLMAALGYASMTTAATSSAKMGVEQPSASPIPMQPVVQGCFKSAGTMVLAEDKIQYNSRGHCGQDVCQKKGKNVAASTEGNKCYCGDTYPPKSDLVDDKNCNLPCTGFGEDACGGLGFYTVYNTGLELYDVPFADDKAGASASSSASVTAVTTIAGGQTVFVTQSSDPSAQKSSGGSNTAGIAAGVVVAVVVVAGIVGGVFFYMRRRRNREIEDEHRRNAAVNSFINGQKPPSSSGGVSISDSRLDPVMAQRRQSSGSIADNEDYSRRILRVTNA